MITISEHLYNQFTPKGKDSKMKKMNRPQPCLHCGSKKIVWDDYSKNPVELLDAVLTDIPEWKLSYELPDGMFRKEVPHYPPIAVRELLANALVHKPYTQGGDIFINIYPDRMEIHNPGRLPIGVTPQNILHTTVKRNEHLAKVFYDLKLMEREGTGYDVVYEAMLMSGRPIPNVQEDLYNDERVTVTIQRRIINEKIIDLHGNSGAL